MSWADKFLFIMGVFWAVVAIVSGDDAHFIVSNIYTVAIISRAKDLIK